MYFGNYFFFIYIIWKHYTIVREKKLFINIKIMSIVQPKIILRIQHHYQEKKIIRSSYWKSII